MYKFCYVFLLFFLYSVFGYIIECFYCSIKQKKIVLNRGFLLGTYLPIYGFGGLLIVSLLHNYSYNPIVLFVMACVISTVLEYFVSYIMEKLFKARWWDYSDMKLNINGRVCLENTILFGIGGLFVVYFMNPFLRRILLKFNPKLLIVISIILMVIFFLDLLVSASTIYGLRESFSHLNKDITAEISEQVRKIVVKNKYFKKRLLNAFPRIKKIKTYEKLKEILDKYHN